MAVFLSPVGGVAAQFFDNNGNPLSGGKLFSYSAGTTTPSVTYTSSLGTTAHTNPIVLDAGGRVPGGEIWLTDGVIYKFVLQTSTNVLIATYDNIVGINSNFVNFTSQQEIQTATAGQTVFNLTTMQYQPSTNGLTVYVDGVNQYGPGAQYAYLETGSNTVTFVSGLHVGASVKFTTTSQTSGNTTTASAVAFTGFNGQTGNVQNLAGDDGSDWIGFDPAGTGAVARSAQEKMRDVVNIADYATSGNYDTAAAALSGRNDLVVRPENESTDLLLSEALNQSRPITTQGRTAPNANFNWFTTDFTVIQAQGPQQAAVLQDLDDVFESKYRPFMTGNDVYVAPASQGGSDSNTGASWASPFLTLNKALRTTACGTVFMWPGTYEPDGFRYTDTQGDRPKKVVAPYGGVTLRFNGDVLSAATWTANGTYPSVWQTTLSTVNHVTRLLLAGTVDEYGLPVPMPLYTSIVDVNNSTLGWYYDSATKILYVRKASENVNTTTKANLTAVYAPGGDNSVLLFSTTSYWENIEFWAYPWVLKVSGQAVPEGWFKNCTIKYAAASSILTTGGHAYSQDCVGYRSTGDNANYNNALGTTTESAEINFSARYAGDVATYGSAATQPANPVSTAQNKNGSSNHDGYVVRVNGEYVNSYGPAVADTDGSYTWSIGSIGGYSFATGASRYGFIVQGTTAKAWYDGCKTVGNSGFNADTSAEGYTFNSFGPQVQSASGTFTTYTPE
jgi:hypothetical protein